MKSRIISQDGFSFSYLNTKGNSEKASLDALRELNEIFSMIVKSTLKKEEISELKYQAVSSHTCQRSFCSNQFKLGMPVLLIRKISGHNTEKAFLQYIRIDEEEASKQLAELWMMQCG